MRTLVLEVRDAGTFLPVLCVEANPDPNLLEGDQLYLLRRVGYACDGRPTIILARLSADGTPCWCDPYGWGDRTLQVAHLYIREHWGQLKSGDVVDVQYILGEMAEPKKSERITNPL